MSELLGVFLRGQIEEIGGAKVDSAFKLNALKLTDILHGAGHLYAWIGGVAGKHFDAVKAETAFGIFPDTVRADRSELVQLRLDRTRRDVEVAHEHAVDRSGDAAREPCDAEIVERLLLTLLRGLRHERSRQNQIKAGAGDEVGDAAGELQPIAILEVQLEAQLRHRNLAEGPGKARGNFPVSIEIALDVVYVEEAAERRRVSCELRVDAIGVIIENIESAERADETGMRRCQREIAPLGILSGRRDIALYLPGLAVDAARAFDLHFAVCRRRRADLVERVAQCKARLLIVVVEIEAMHGHVTCEARAYEILQELAKPEAVIVLSPCFGGVSICGNVDIHLQRIDGDLRQSNLARK